MSPRLGRVAQVALGMWLVVAAIILGTVVVGWVS